MSRTVARPALCGVLVLLLVAAVGAAGCGGGAADDLSGTWRYTGQLTYRGVAVENSAGSATLSQRRSDLTVTFDGEARSMAGQRPFRETLSVIVRDGKIVSLPFTATVQLDRDPVTATLSATGTASRDRIALTLVYNLPQGNASYTFSLTRGTSPGG